MMHNAVTTSYQAIQAPLSRFGLPPGTKILKLPVMSDVDHNRTIYLDEFCFVPAQQ
ncbi:MAG: hypothetical protein KKI08_26480 [Armatimonadetes bacterium]|nr:hypothetical protein [Armatimonadota bacterium]